MDPEDLTGVPLFFVRTAEPRALIARVGVGAVLGAIAGLAIYFNDKWVTNNVLSQANNKVVENYHPDLLK